MADTITVFKGDGIGPEITDCVLDILKAAGAVRTLPGARHKSAVQNKLARRYHIIQRAG